MIKFLSVAFATVTLAASATAAQAQTVVPAGKTTEVDFVGSYNMRTCQNGPRAQVRIRNPKHGRVSTKWVSRKIQANQVRSGGRKCVGRTMKGMAVYYTPNRGYRGADSFRINWSYPTGNGTRRSAGGTVRVRVQ